MKKKKWKNITYTMALVLAFFFGRESKELTKAENNIPISTSVYEEPDLTPVYFEAAIEGSGVFVCNGTSSKRYHYTKSCRGLSACRTSISKITLEEAKRRRRTLCGWED